MGRTVLEENDLGCDYSTEHKNRQNIHSITAAATDLCVDTLTHLYAPVGDADRAIPSMEGHHDAEGSHSRLYVGPQESGHWQSSLLPLVVLQV